ncbi:MAG: T9SS type A sorting domain-containing protein [Bacteroidota bacterium]
MNIFYVGRESKALELSEQLIKEYSNHPLTVEWLYGQGLMYKYEMNDVVRAEEIFKEVVEKSPEHGTALSAKEQLGKGEKYLPKAQIALPALPMELTVNNYPNPFNPVTIIQATLPEADKFTLKVYNMLGKEVATLFNGGMNAGIHKVNFDASQLASGVYVYKLIGKNINISKKMMLRK